MRVLAHLCCGPCGITVLQRLLDAGHEISCLFFNPNIQPLAEYMRRREGVVQVAERLGLPLIMADTLPAREQGWEHAWTDGREEPLFTPGSGGAALPPAVNPALWLRSVAGREGERCAFCWRIRLEKTARFAAEWGFDGFTSSLLYSRHQDHNRIRELGEGIARESGRAFLYQDFRTSWQEGVRLSREWGIYRQQYCGCLFSEYDRYSRAFADLRGGE